MGAAPFTPKTDDQLADYRTAVSRLLRTTDGRDLNGYELIELIPPVAPAGHYQNRVRGTILMALNRAGFTHHGRRLS